METETAKRRSRDEVKCGLDKTYGAKIRKPLRGQVRVRVRSGQVHSKLGCLLAVSKAR